MLYFTMYFSMAELSKAERRIRARQNMRAYRLRRKLHSSDCSTKHYPAFRQGMAVVVLSSSRHKGLHAGKLGWVVNISHHRKYKLLVQFDFGSAYFSFDEVVPIKFLK